MEFKDIVGMTSAREKLDLASTEKAMRLPAILDEIAKRPALGMLAFKGGTALNFGYLKDWKRLSVDLDFNAVGTKEKLNEDRDIVIKPALYEIAASLGYKPKPDDKYGLSRYDLFYNDITGKEIYLKVEISFTGRTAILPIEKKEFNFPFIGKKVNAPALSLEELLAEKLSALYGREKGRDIFDTYTAMSLSPDMELMRKILIYKLALAKIAFKPDEFFNKIRRFSKKTYKDDMMTYVRGNLPEFEIVKKSVIEHYIPLKKLDDRDMMFIEFCRDCLGEQISKASKAKIEKSKEIMHPLKMLFGDLKITEEARNLTVDELRVSLAYKRK